MDPGVPEEAHGGTLPPEAQSTRAGTELRLTHLNLFSVSLELVKRASLMLGIIRRFHAGKI